MATPNNRPDARNPGDSSGEATPVPIPNTEVKLSSAEDTERAAFREHRSSPGFLRFRPVDRLGAAPLRYPVDAMTATPEREPSAGRGSAARQARSAPTCWSPSGHWRNAEPSARSRLRGGGRADPARARDPAPAVLRRSRRLPALSRRRSAAYRAAVPLVPLRPVARTAPVVVDRGRPPLPLPHVGDRRPLGQAVLALAMIAAVGALLVARLGPPARPPGPARARRRACPPSSPAPRPARRRFPRPARRRRRRRRRPPAPSRPGSRRPRREAARARPTRSSPATRCRRSRSSSGPRSRCCRSSTASRDPSAHQARPGRSRSRDRAQRWQPRQYEVTNPPGFTSVIRVPHRGQGVPPLLWTARKSRTWVSNVGGTRTRRTSIASAQRRAGRRVQGVDLLRGERRSLPERQQARRMEDLVAVGVADPGDELLVLEQVLELARMAPDPRPPLVEGQRRIVGIGTELGVEAGDGTIEPGRQEVDLAHLGRIAVADLDRAIVGGRARRHRASSAAASGGAPPARGPKPSTSAVFVGSFGSRCGQLEPTGQHRVDHDPVPVEVDEQELAAPPDRLDRAARRGRSARPACPRTASGASASARVDRPPDQGRVEGLGDDRSGRAASGTVRRL